MLIPVVASIALVQAAPATVQVKSAGTIVGARAIAYAAAPTGSRFAASMEDGTIRIIDAPTRRTIKTLTGHPQPCYGIAWSPDGTFLATGDESARIFVWDTRTWNKLREFRTHTRGIQALSFNWPRTLLISTGRDDAVKVYDVSKPGTKEILTILGEGANFYGASFIGKTDHFGVSILSYGARVYNARTGKVVGFMTAHDGQGSLDIDFNPAGSRGVTAGRDNSAAVWDVKTVRRLNSLRGHEDWLIDTQISPNGKLVATSSTDRTVRIWDMANYKQVALLEDQTSVGSPLAWTGDGKHLITVNVDEFIQIHNVTPPQPAVPEKAAPAPKAPAKKPPVKKKGG